MFCTMLLANACGSPEPASSDDAAAQNTDSASSPTTIPATPPKANGEDVDSDTAIEPAPAPGPDARIDLDGHGFFVPYDDFLDPGMLIRASANAVNGKAGMYLIWEYKSDIVAVNLDDGQIDTAWLRGDLFANGHFTTEDTEVTDQGVMQRVVYTDFATGEVVAEYEFESDRGFDSLIGGYGFSEQGRDRSIVDFRNGEWRQLAPADYDTDSVNFFVHAGAVINYGVDVYSDTNHAFRVDPATPTSLWDYEWGGEGNDSIGWRDNYRTYEAPTINFGNPDQLDRIDVQTGERLEGYLTATDEREGFVEMNTEFYRGNRNFIHRNNWLSEIGPDGQVLFQHETSNLCGFLSHDEGVAVLCDLHGIYWFPDDPDASTPALVEPAATGLEQSGTAELEPTSALPEAWTREPGQLRVPPRIDSAVATGAIGTIDEFTPDGFELMEVSYWDFTFWEDTEIDDAVVVYRHERETTIEPIARILVVLRGLGGDQFEVLLASDRVVMCAACGMDGEDPFVIMRAGGGGFFVNHRLEHTRVTSFSAVRQSDNTVIWRVESDATSVPNVDGAHVLWRDEDLPFDEYDYEQAIALGSGFGEPPPTPTPIPGPAQCPDELAEWWAGIWIGSAPRFCIGDAGVAFITVDRSIGWALFRWSDPYWDLRDTVGFEIETPNRLGITLAAHFTPPDATAICAEITRLMEQNPGCLNSDEPRVCPTVFEFEGSQIAYRVAGGISCEDGAHALTDNWLTATPENPLWECATLNDSEIKDATAVCINVTEMQAVIQLGAS